jgi:HAD superfamily hydrolase (TIGR01549 family)
VVSNHVPELPTLIDALGLSSFFDAVISSGVVGYEKPHRRMFETAREHTIFDRTIWMVGDNPSADCVAAVAFGVKAILVRAAGRFEPRVDDLWGVLRLVID